jgi:3-oxoacyl-[acyl-carrier-protein] synthase-1
MGRTAFVVGTGARTPLGLDAASSAAAVRAGVAAMNEHPFMLDKQSEPMIVCLDAGLPVTVTGSDRLLALALSAAREALTPLRERRHTLPRLCLFLALPEERPGRDRRLEQTLGGRLVSMLSDEIVVSELVCHPRGHAGGLLCLEQALALIAGGRSDLCLVGGVDSYLEAETLEWLDNLDQLHSLSTIWGFCPGEAAGFCLLASPERAASLGLFPSLEILAAASAIEPNCIKTDTICLGRGLTQAFAKTLAILPGDRRVNHTICDMNGEPYRANEYGFTVLRSPNKFTDEADFQTPADGWGDVGAASGPLFLVLDSFAARKRYRLGPLTLVWASSEKGLRAAALLHGASAPVGGS